MRKRINSIRQVIRTLNKTYLTIFFIAVMSILLIDFWLINIPEYFKYGYEIGQAYYKICIGLIGAFITYFFIIHLEKEKDKKSYAIHVNNLFGSLYQQQEKLFLKLKESAGEKDLKICRQHLSKVKIVDLCEKIDPHHWIENSLEQGFGNWTNYLDYKRRETRRIIREILVFKEILTRSEIESLMKINSCKFFEVFEMAKFTNYDSLNFIGKDVAEYILLIHELNQVFKNNLGNYINNSLPK